MFKGVSDYLKYSLSKNYISKTDLYTTDKIVLAKVEPFHGKDKHLQLLFDRMSNKIPFKDDSKDFEREVFCKSRVVDPLCKHNTLDHLQTKYLMRGRNNLYISCHVFEM